MLNKFLANLPFNPGLINQVSFYGQRMRAESSIRRIGFGFTGLALIIQIFAVLSPAQPSLAASSNDLINGGFTSAAEAANDCRSNIEGYGTILANYGITCDKVASANTITINSADWNGQLWSMGRLPYGIAGETPISIAGTTFYIRYLNGWGNSNYRALNVTSAGGQTLLLLYNCGNVTSVGQPVPVAKLPVLSISKSMGPGFPAANSTVAPGTTLLYYLTFSNKGGPAKNVTVTDHTPANTTYAGFIGGGGTTSEVFNSSSNAGIWTYANLPAGTLNYTANIKFKINSNAANGTTVCNVGTITATGVSTLTSNQVCVTVKVNAPKPPVTPPAAPVCPYDSAILQSSSQCVVCSYNNTIIASDSQCKPCPDADSQNPTACVVPSKAAANLTENISNADGTTAAAGDVIQYTLFAKNTGKGTVKDYQFTENLSDVLDYADVQDLNGGALDNTTGIVTWPKVDIPADQTVQKTFTVKVKDPIPATPQSTSDPMHFDHIMTNVYGNTINIHLPQSVVQASAQASQSLPNTGPGTSLLIGGAVVMVMGYFFARARLLGKEVALVASDYVTTGGA